MKEKFLPFERLKRAALLFLLLCVAGVSQSLAQTFTVGNLNYSINEDGASVTVTGHVDGQNASGELVIPESVEQWGNTYTITFIAAYAFDGCSGLTGEFVIPDAITSIGQAAFRNCTGITTLTIGSGLELVNSQWELVHYSESAFYNCTGITTLNYNAINTIGYALACYGDDWNCYNLLSVFSTCSSLATINIGENVQSIPIAAFKHTNVNTVNYNATNCNSMGGYYCTEQYAFEACDQLNTINIGENVQTIPANAFRECSSLTSVVFSESVTTIGGFAFYGCSGLTGTLTIPESVTTIGDRAFANTGFATVNFYATNCTYMSDYNNPVFADCNNLTTLNIGENVEIIPEFAFSYCSNLTGNLSIPNSVVTIGRQAFRGCTGLTGTLTIPESVTSIGARAFANTGFTALNYNAINCTYMGFEYGGHVFQDCNALETLNIGESVQTIPDYAFFLCNFSGALNIPNTVTSIGQSAFSNCSGLTGSLTISENVTWMGGGVFTNTNFTTLNYNAVDCSISDSPFSNCSSLTTLNIGNQVQTIPNGMFAYLSNISGTLSLPNSLISIGSEAFYGCSGFTGNLLIPNSVNTIGFFAFRECSGFDGTLTLGNSVVTIGNNAFYKCYGLTGELVIPNSVETIGIGAFIDCDFTKITIGTGVFSIATSVFRRCANLTEVEWNATNCQLAGNTEYPIFNECSSLASVTFGDNVQNIPAYAFYNCASFTGNLDLPNSLISIGDQAFYNCYGFEGIVMGNSVETIGSEAFRNCGGFRGELTLPEPLVSVGTYAFAGCTDIGTVNYNATNCETMGNASQNVFAECFSLTHLRIGENVESIPNYAFKPCFLLQDMSVGAVVPPVIQVSTFGSVPRVIPVHVPFGSGEAYRNAPYWEEFFNITEDYSPSQYSCHWSVNAHQFSDNMTVIGLIQIDGEEQMTDALEVGAFCGDECRGRQLLAYYPDFGRYLLFLTIYGEDGDALSFRLYDHGAGAEIDKGCTTHLTFLTDDIIGTLTDPHPFNFVAMQDGQLAAGWNWWSAYVELGDDGLALLQEGLDTHGIMIKSQNNGFVSYLDGFGWYGSLASINNENTYQIRVSEACALGIAGAAAQPAEHPISLNSGWNWIGYPVSTGMTIAEALSGLTPQTNDMLKSQNDGFVSYLEGFGWYGSLNTLQPGMGLMYKSNNNSAVTLVYPSGGSKEELKANQTAGNNHWQPNLNAYPDNMSVMAVVEVDGEELQGENYELAAFANGEVRGSARLLYVEPLNRYMAFLTIAGNEASDLRFGLYNAETGAIETQCLASLQYETNAVVGSFSEPYVVSFRGNTGMDEWTSSLQVFPNPVERGQSVSIGFSDVETGEVRVEIINALGMVVETQCIASQQAIKAPNAAGVYTLRVTIEGKATRYQKLIVR